MKRLFFCVITLSLGFSIVNAQTAFSANDLDPANLTETKIWGDFKIVAKPDKNVTIEALEVPRESEDGEVFNNRIKLNGAGTIEYRSVFFKTAKATEITIYCNSSSKTDSRVLVLYDTGSGKQLAEFNAPPDSGTKAGIVKATIPSDGTYIIYSKSGGINIYQIVIE